MASSSSRNLDRCRASPVSGLEEQQTSMPWRKNPGTENIEAMITAGRYSQGRRHRSPSQGEPSTQASQPAQDTPTTPKCYDGLRSCPPLASPTNPHTLSLFVSPPISDEEEEEACTVHIAKLCPIYKPDTPHLTHIHTHTDTPKPKLNLRPIPHPPTKYTRTYPPNTPLPQTLRRPAQLKRAPSISNLRNHHPSSFGPHHHFFSPQGQATLSQFRLFLSLPDSVPPSTILYNLLTKWTKIRATLPKVSPRLAREFNNLEWWGVQYEEVADQEEGRVIEAWLSKKRGAESSRVR
ncbi:hypothetical protein QBC44DRAFT_365474 [Cladorrhinum sp. PSN332]|nr:hypothetical protein QBC44DRAFT_365474 [Cladorrhinum sp. PSN332]